MERPTDPYGLQELERKLSRSKKSGRLRCPVRGCSHWLKPPSRKPKFIGEPCPEHAVVIHSSGTWSYADDYRRNLITDADYFHQHIRYHDFKVEAYRFGSERSEDAVTWNIFRGLQHAGLLHRVIRQCTGLEECEPQLYLWGLHIGREGVKPWDLLLGARDKFESDLPVDRPKTEPDIALHIPGRLLVLIEAKFTSSNPTYQYDHRKLLDLTLGQLLQIYQWPDMRLLDVQEARRREAIHYQLWRNLVFADYMAQLDSPQTRAYVVNLVREGYETEACEPMLTLMPSNYRDRFEQISWEQIYALAQDAGLDVLCSYMLNKTERLRPAFKLRPNRSVLRR